MAALYFIAEKGFVPRNLLQASRLDQVDAAMASVVTPAYSAEKTPQSIPNSPPPEYTADPSVQEKYQVVLLERYCSILCRIIGMFL